MFHAAGSISSHNRSLDEPTAAKIVNRKSLMPSETLHFKTTRLATLAVHAGQALADQLGVKATAREGWIKLEGPPDGLERAKHLFISLENSLKAGAPVRNREFMQALNIVKHEGVSTLKDLMNDRVLTHDKKPGVTAKTVGQKKYLDAIRKHDITFGVGPAGTGKTYLAVAMALAALRDGKVSRIILTRPAVEAGEALGFLPGDLYEKILPYLRPLHDALHDMLPAEEIGTAVAYAISRPGDVAVENITLSNSKGSL